MTFWKTKSRAEVRLWVCINGHANIESSVECKTCTTTVRSNRVDTERVELTREEIKERQKEQAELSRKEIKERGLTGADMDYAPGQRLILTKKIGGFFKKQFNFRLGSPAVVVEVKNGRYKVVIKYGLAYHNVWFTKDQLDESFVREF